VALEGPEAMLDIEGFARSLVLPLGFGVLQDLLPFDLVDLAYGQARAPSKETVRTYDYVWRVPGELASTIRVELPDGYTVPQLPPDEERTAGTTVLRRRVRREGDRVLVASLSFTSGAARISAAAHSALVAELARWSALENLSLAIDHPVESLRRTATPEKAVFEGQRLVGAHPRSGYYHTMLALAYTEIGLMSAARREARLGAELTPESAYAQQILGFVFERDSFGRPYAGDYDRETALRARRRQVEMEPDRFRPPLDLALLLARDAHGAYLPPGVPLDEIIALCRRSLAKGGRDETRALLLDALSHAGRFTEVETEIRGKGGSVEREASWLLVAVTVLRGADVARAGFMSTPVNDDERGRVVAQAQTLLARLRRYREVAALVTALSDVLPSAAASAEAALATRPHEELRFAAGDPRETLRRLILACQRPDTFAKETAALVTPEVIAAYRAGYAGRACGSTLLPVHRVDWVLSAAIDRAGTPDVGYRLVVRPPGATAAGEHTYFFTVDRRRGPLIAGFDFVDAGREALRLVQAGQPHAARLWVDWATPLYDRSDGPGQVVRPNVRAFRTLWSGRLPAARAAVVGPAAALLVVEAKGNAPALELLDRASREEANAGLRRDLRMAYVLGLAAAGRHAEALAALDALAPGVAADEDLPRLRLRVLRASGRLDEAWEVASRFVADRPADLERVRNLAAVAEQRGDYDRAIELRRRLTAAGTPTLDDWNQYAWDLYGAGRAAEAIEPARKANAGSGTSPARLHTLAAALADAGSLREARTTLLRVADLAGAAPFPANWLVLGAIAERVGQSADALAAYDHVPRTPDSEAWGGSVEALIAKRRARLGAQPALHPAP
jgi:tetratricopeptide (TPR) repeat protein